MAFDYSAFGLRVVSEMALPGLAPALSGQAPQVVVSLGVVPAHLPEGSPPAMARRYFEARPGQLLLYIKDVGRMLVEEGSRILLEPSPQADPVNVRLALLNVGFSVVLHQRGALALHASAVVAGEGAVLFCGHRRAGKSTLAAGLHQRGWQLMGDDKVAIALENGQVIAVPSFPQLRLWRDALDYLGVQGFSLEQIPASEKYNLEIPGAFSSESLPLKAIYLLTPSQSDQIVLRPLNGMEKFRLVQQHTYANQFLRGMGQLPIHFRLSSEVARQIPMVQICRPSTTNRLGDLIDQVDAELRGL